ncbi:MAG: DEAD/DEAH box helicase, partial [Spirochaetes bacterium]|nr:DEAD/DEAH box helicase [Spirochaetota bacterium]
MENFKKLGLSDESCHALTIKGFEEPTEIQEKVIPLLLHSEKDVIGQAQTGTGKTAAFGLPILERLKEGQKDVQVLILTPTRELALQVAEEINSLKGKRRIRIAPIYGGQAISQQFQKLKKGIDIVVGTPGRIIDHIKRGTLVLSHISYLVLDEADEMLNMGFIDDIKEIIKHTNKHRKILLFSATMPERIRHLAENYMGKYEFIKIQKKNLTVELTNQIYFEVAAADKQDALCRIIDVEPEFYALIFCRTKINVKNLAKKLGDRGYDVDALHGDMSQGLREKVLKKFKDRKINILVATDVAARGIDIIDLTHVINYSLPQDPESYIHRIGRTGRAGKQGTAITFITPSEYRQLMLIERVAKTSIEKASLPNVKDIV